MTVDGADDARTVLRALQELVDARVGFAPFGEVVVVQNGSEWRKPIRMTGLAVRDGGRSRLRQFHGSIPSPD